MRPRIKQDVYLTPVPLAEAVVSWLGQHYAVPSLNWNVLDPGAGNGVWGQAVLAHLNARRLNITGLDIRRLKAPVGYDQWHSGLSYLDYASEYAGTGYDLIIGNPPFLLAEEFLNVSLKLMHRYGLLVFLLPCDFLYTQGRGRGLYKEHPPEQILHLMQRPNFTGPRGESLGTANTDNYFVGIWRKTEQSQFVFTHWLDWKPAKAKTA